MFLRKCFPPNFVYATCAFWKMGMMKRVAWRWSLVQKGKYYIMLLLPRKRVFLLLWASFNSPLFGLYQYHNCFRKHTLSTGINNIIWPVYVSLYACRHISTALFVVWVASIQIDFRDTDVMIHIFGIRRFCAEVKLISSTLFQLENAFSGFEIEL